MKYHKKNLSKPVLFLTASLMACQPVSALGVTFSDLDKVPWPGAETSIQKAADLGLMVGETQDGKTVFRPRDSVSLCETAQLAYKVMVNTGKLTADSSVTEKWSTTMQTYQIPDWAYTAVAQCLEKNGNFSRIFLASKTAKCRIFRGWLCGRKERAKNL